MIHRFETEIAKQYGLLESVLLHHFAFWIKQNELNNREDHYHDGKWWTYTTMTELNKNFDYVSLMQLRTAMKNLVNKGALIKGNYNKRGFDHTLWYALGDGVNIDLLNLTNRIVNFNKSNCQNEQIELLSPTNRIVNSNNAIPYSKTQIINTNNKPNACNPIAMFEEKFHFINRTVAERLRELEQSCGIDVVVTAIERTKQNNIPVVNAIKYIESTAKGIASGHDFAKQKTNDVVAAAERLQQALDAERIENGDNSTKCSDAIWGVWADKR